MESSLCVISNWLINKKVYTILISNTITGSSNLDNCFYRCLILISISHLKALFNLLLLLLLFIIYIVNLLVVWPRSCQVIYYFDTLTLGRKYQYFGRVNMFSLLLSKSSTLTCIFSALFTTSASLSTDSQHKHHQHPSIVASCLLHPPHWSQPYY